jgi:glycosyltransferase XagB
LDGIDVLLTIACLGWLPVIRGSAIRLAALRRAHQTHGSRASTIIVPPSTSFSLVVPARREAAVLPATLAALGLTDHPQFEILVVVDADDAPTLRAAQAAAREAPERIRVLVHAGGSGRKPAALNHALLHCRYDVVGVFDADGIVHSGLLRAVDECFALTGADAVQAGNQPFAARPHWYQLHNMLEFYVMFLNESSAVPGRLVRLSGNSVFVRTTLLRDVGGWRETALAEDCDLGMRLTARGARLAFLYRPELATVEETPVSLAAFIRQRTRWNQGFLQVLRDGGWWRLPTRALRRKAADVLLTHLARAVLGVGLPVQVLAAALAGSPLVWAPAVAALPGAVNAVLSSALLPSFGRNFAFPVRWRHHVQVLLGWPAYQLLLVVPAVRAAIRQLRGRDDWEKTTHVGVTVPARS